MLDEDVLMLLLQLLLLKKTSSNPLFLQQQLIKKPYFRNGRVAYPLALIISPTRELSCQIHDEAKKFSYQTGVKVVVAYGGAPMHQQRSSSFLTLGERLCAAFIPFIALIEILIFSVSDCFECSSSDRHNNPKMKLLSKRGFDDLASETRFSVNEVEALFELFKKLSNSIIEDGLIHKEELQLALFQAPHGENLFLDRVFDLFDEKKNGVIEFEEFAHSLSVFHPCAPVEEKIDFAFRLYDLRQTGYIEREEVQQMVIAILSESDLVLSEDLLESIIDQTFADADADMDGKINKVARMEIFCTSTSFTSEEHDSSLPEGVDAFQMI